MGLRDRLKSKVKRALGASAPGAHAKAGSPSSPPDRPAAPRREPPTSTATPKPKPAPPPAKPTAKPTNPEDAAKAAKVAKHFEKTRKAVLKKLAEEGGEAELALLHDYSERRYFIAHKKFSDLMEGLVAEELLLFDHGSGMATLTDGGRAYIAG